MFPVLMPRSTRLTFAQALDEQPRRHQQRHRESELRRHESVTEAGCRPSARRLSGVFLERLHQPGACSVQGRIDPEEDCRSPVTTPWRTRRPRAPGIDGLARVHPGPAEACRGLGASSARRADRRRRRGPPADTIRSATGGPGAAAVAPIDRRTAISAARADNRASSRFATLAHAMRTTMPVTAKSSRSRGVTASSRKLCPRRPPVRRIGLATNSASRRSLRSACNGASTSVRMLR